MYPCVCVCVCMSPILPVKEIILYPEIQATMDFLPAPHDGRRVSHHRCQARQPLPVLSMARKICSNFLTSGAQDSYSGYVLRSEEKKVGKTMENPGLFTGKSSIADLFFTRLDYQKIAESQSKPKPKFVC